MNSVNFLSLIIPPFTVIEFLHSLHSLFALVFLSPMLIRFAYHFAETTEGDFGEPPPEEAGLHQQHSQRQRKDEYYKGTLMWESKGMAALKK